MAISFVILVRFVITISVILVVHCIVEFYVAQLLEQYFIKLFINISRIYSNHLQLNSVLSIGDPTSSSDGATSTTVASAITLSTTNSDRVSLNLGDTPYTIYHAITADSSSPGATSVTGNSISGMTISAAASIDTDSSGTTGNVYALSITDFNLFRKRVAAAIDTLDEKIRAILDLGNTAISC